MYFVHNVFFFFILKMHRKLRLAPESLIAKQWLSSQVNNLDTDTFVNNAVNCILQIIEKKNIVYIIVMLDCNTYLYLLYIDKVP